MWRVFLPPSCSWDTVSNWCPVGLIRSVPATLTGPNWLQTFLKILNIWNEMNFSDKSIAHKNHCVHLRKITVSRMLFRHYDVNSGWILTRIDYVTITQWFTCSCFDHNFVFIFLALILMQSMRAVNSLPHWFFLTSSIDSKKWFSFVKSIVIDFSKKLLYVTVLQKSAIITYDNQYDNMSIKKHKFPYFSWISLRRRERAKSPIKIISFPRTFPTQRPYFAASGPHWASNTGYLYKENTS